MSAETFRNAGTDLIRIHLESRLGAHAAILAGIEL